MLYRVGINRLEYELHDEKNYFLSNVCLKRMGISMTFMPSTYHTFVVHTNILVLFSISSVFCKLNKIFINCYMRYHNRILGCKSGKGFAEYILVLVRISET